MPKDCKRKITHYKGQKVQGSRDSGKVSWNFQLVLGSYSCCLDPRWWYTRMKKRVSLPWYHSTCSCSNAFVGNPTTYPTGSRTSVPKAKLAISLPRSVSLTIFYLQLIEPSNIVKRTKNHSIILYFPYAINSTLVEVSSR